MFTIVCVHLGTTMVHWSAWSTVNRKWTSVEYVCPSNSNSNLELFQFQPGIIPIPTWNDSLRSLEFFDSLIHGKMSPLGHHSDVTQRLKEKSDDRGQPST